MDPISLGFMLSLQASGMVVDWLGKNEQVRLGKMGAQVEQAGIASNIASSRLEAEDASLQSMKQLRMNLGTQAAMMAARGTRSGAGTSALFGNESVGNFNADQRIRSINQSGREAQFKAQSVLSGLHEKTNSNNIWNEFRTNVIKKIPTDPDSYKQAAQAFGLTKAGG